MTLKTTGAALAAILSMTFGAPEASAEPWTIKLTAKQERALSEMPQKKAHAAFAASPGGQWGRSWGKSSAAAAERAALEYCQEHLRVGKPGCAVIYSKGRMASQGRVDVPRVSEVYKAINGSKAAQFYGMLGQSFQGNVARAQAQYKMTRSDGQAWRKIPKSRAMERALTGAGLVNAGQNGWAVYLDGDRAIHYASPKRGKVLKSVFKEWAISEDGLLCMFFGAHASGKKRSTTCMIIASMQQGVIRYNWAHAKSMANMRKGFIVAGNPGRSAAR